MNEQTVDIFDSLGQTDFEGVDTSMPVLRPGLYTFSIKNMARELWKSGEGSSIRIDLALEDEAVDVSGERTISPGYPIIDRISLVQKGQYDPKTAIARFLDSVGMRNQPFDTSFQSYLGQTLQVKTKVEPETPEWPAKPAVGSYVKA